MNNLLGMYQQLMSNPASLLAQKYNIPQSVDMNDPNAILNHLVSTGQVNQMQINNAMAMRNNPLIQMLMRGR
jgi:hypothetical protein